MFSAREQAARCNQMAAGAFIAAFVGMGITPSSPKKAISQRRAPLSPNRKCERVIAADLTFFNRARKLIQE